MSTQTSTEPMADKPNGPELIDRVTKLDPVARPQPFKVLSLPPDESEGTPEEIQQSCREEILRRLESIQNGTAKFYTVEETLAHLDALCGPDGES